MAKTRASKAKSKTVVFFVNEFICSSPLIRSINCSQQISNIAWNKSDKNDGDGECERVVNLSIAEA
jgi:hypothetical protein